MNSNTIHYNIVENTNPKKQIIDTSNDYMSRIYDFVVMKKQKKDIYNIINDDFKAFLNSDSYIPTILNGKVYVIEEIDNWMRDYIKNLSDVNKNKIYKKYGHLTLIKELPKITDSYGFDSVNDFLIESENDHECKIIMYIIENYIIKDNIPIEYYNYM